MSAMGATAAADAVGVTYKGGSQPRTRSGGAGRATCCAVLLLLACLAALAPSAAGQGLKWRRSGNGTALKASRAQLTLQGQYGRSKADLKSAQDLLNKFRAAGGRARGGRCGSLCAAAPALAAAPASLIAMVTSPPAYDSRDPGQTGGYAGVTPSGPDQGRCGACVAFAVGAAAEAAVAAALRRGARALSQGDLFFCGGGGRRCQDGWELEVALQELEQRRGVRPYECLRWPAAADLQSIDPKEVCSARCGADAPKGRFRTTVRAPFADLATLEEHIRAHGAAITRLNVFPDMIAFFKRSPRGVYRNASAAPELGARGAEAHAVAIVGYNNTGQYFIIKNSWGSGFADGGFARVAFGTAGIADLDYTYGVMFEPSSSAAAAPLPLEYDKSLKDGCAWYRVQRGDYISRVARVVGMGVTALLRANAGYVTALPSLDVWLRPGDRLVVCSDSVVRRFNPALLGTKAREQRALLAMRSALDPGGRVLGSWRNGSDPCYTWWQGVNCDERRERVTSIVLYGLPLAGDISSVDLAPLGALRRVSLARTTLRGKLPAAWSKASSLQYLDLNSAQSITGTLPPEWAALSQLDTLSVARCGLTGSLPAAWGNGMARLRRLDATDNVAMGGPLPPEWGRLRALELLGLSRTGVTGTIPESWGELAQLEVLWLGENALTGPLPSWSTAKGLKRLQLLFLESQRAPGIAGTVPASWAAALPQVASFGLFGNPGLGGCIPKSWATNTPKLSADVFEGWGQDLPRKRFHATKICGYCSSSECAAAARSAAAAGAAPRGSGGGGGGGAAGGAGARGGPPSAGGAGRKAP